MLNDVVYDDEENDDDDDRGGKITKIYDPVRLNGISLSELRLSCSTRSSSRKKLSACGVRTHDLWLSEPALDR